jgi:Transglutaminase-like superfamily
MRSESLDRNRSGRLTCLATVLLVRVGLSLIGLPRLHRALGRAANTRARWTGIRLFQQEPQGLASRIAEVSAFCPARLVCLEQSMALWFLLRCRGAAAKLQIGIQPLPFSAHAWVELDGEIVNEDPDYVRSFVLLSHA